MRFGLTTRVLVLAGSVLLALWLAVIIAFYVNRDLARTAASPLPEQLAAIADLLTPLSPPAREAALDAVRSTQMKAWLTTLPHVPDHVPEAGTAPSADLTAYRQEIGARLLSVEVRSGAESGLPRLFANRMASRVFWIGLGGDAVVAIEAIAPVVLTLYGLPVGLGAGLLGTLMACIALLLLHREIRPLAELAAVADRIAPMGEPVPLPAVRASTPEVERLVRAFDRLQARIHAMTRARLALIGGIQHDVRSFATRLRLRIEHLPDRLERAQATADIGDMIELLDNALLTARAGVGALDEELLDLDDLLKAEVAAFQRAGRPVTLDPEQPHAPVWVLADRVALRRMIGNIIDNAVTYGGRAMVKLCTGSGQAQLQVCDEGPGFPPQIRAVLLEPFTRAEPSRARRTGGAGLGLAVARSLVEAHGGTIALDDAPGGGGRVTLTLPVFEPR